MNFNSLLKLVQVSSGVVPESIVRRQILSSCAVSLMEKVKGYQTHRELDYVPAT